MRAVERHPEYVPQISFQGCTVRPEPLLLKCADSSMTAWLEQSLDNLHPWENVKLRPLQRDKLSKPRVCVVYIPDDVNSPALTWDQVKKRLRTMNHGLRTGEWTCLHRIARDRTYMDAVGR